MGKFILRMKEERSYVHFDGYYTGESYTFQGGRYACVDKDITKAKQYTSKKRAENACKMEFENYWFEVEEIK